MAKGTTILYDGQRNVRAGVDSSIAPSAILQNQVSWAINTTFRESFPTPRPPWHGRWLVYENESTKERINSGVFQTACFYENPNGAPSIIVQRGGRLFQIIIEPQRYSVKEITVKNNVFPIYDFTVPAVGASVDIYVNHIEPFLVSSPIVIADGTYNPTLIASDQEVTIDGATVIVDIVRAVYSGGSSVATVTGGTPIYQDGAILQWNDTNPAGELFAYAFQAENWAIIMQGQNNPILFDGSAARRSGGLAKQEIPPGYCGAYINGRIWVAKPNRSEFVAGDLINSTGSLGQQSGIDAILGFTNNTFLNEGGSFSVPSNAGPITAIIATVQLDTSLGQGPVSIYTTNSIFTNAAPPDAATWKDLQFPIQTVAQVDYGSVAPRAVVNVNSDTWYRSPNGVQPFIIGRRNFNSGWGNTTMSNEMLRVLNYEAEPLVEYESAVLFDNRFLMTCSPKLTTNGVVFQGVAVMNFDEISTMWNRSNPCWEGVWTGLNIFQLVRGRYDGVEHCFALACGTNGELEVWEQVYDGYEDVCVSSIDGTITTTTSPIVAVIETRSFDFKTPFELKQLSEGELYVDRLAGQADFSVKLRPDQYPAWVDWQSWSECNKNTSCDEFCGIPVGYKPGYRPYMQLQMPPETALTGAVNRVNRGYEFQVYLRWTSCRIKQLRLTATVELEPLAKGF